MFDMKTGRFIFEPDYITNAPKLMLDECKEHFALRGEKRMKVGIITPYRNEHGVTLYYATSVYRNQEEALFYSESAAKFWLEIIAA